MISSSLIGASSAYKFEPMSVVLDDQTKLPITNEKTQRMYLVRHGESEANVYFEVDGKKIRFVSGKSTGILLTKEGESQIAQTAEKISGCFPTDTKLVLVSSSAVRTRETAKILFEVLSKSYSKIELINDLYQGLDERSLGDWEGRYKDELYAEAESFWRGVSAQQKYITPEVAGGECYSEVAERALDALADIYKKYQGATVLVVTSFNTMNAITIQTSDALGKLSQRPESTLPKINLGNGDILRFDAEREIGFSDLHLVSHIKSGFNSH